MGWRRLKNQSEAVEAVYPQLTRAAAMGGQSTFRELAGKTSFDV
jgi:hypothetical protein